MQTSNQSCIPLMIQHSEPKVVLKLIHKLVFKQKDLVKAEEPYNYSCVKQNALSELMIEPVVKTQIGTADNQESWWPSCSRSCKYPIGNLTLNLISIIMCKLPKIGNAICTLAPLLSFFPCIHLLILRVLYTHGTHSK